MSAHQTTAPFQSTIGSAPIGSALIIRWVHPSPEGPVSPLDVGRFLLGRGEKCRTRLEAEAVSRYHAEVLLDGSGPRIRDLGSKNGVHVNGARVEECPLQAGDVLRLGACVGVVVAREPELVGFGEPFPGLLAGPVFWPVLDAARAVARTDLPVIIEGETGTGKERVARAIHSWTGRNGAFVALNCAALPESLAEAELFGYRKGAFTGADRPSQGHFRAADGGTLLLDEVVDLPLPLQAKVLRAIEAREVVPLGETRPVPVDVRLVAAAQTSLHEAVGQKRFRADLLARLDGATVRLPPLRERIQEVPFLFTRLASRHVSRLPALDPRLIEALCRHDWPYNVRELEACIKRCLALTDSPVLDPELLPDAIREPADEAADAGTSRGSLPPLPHGGDPRPDALRSSVVPSEAELRSLLATHRGNVAAVGRELGKARMQIHRWMKRHGIQIDEYRG